MAVRTLYLTGFAHLSHGGRAARAHARSHGARPDGFSRLIDKFIPVRSLAGQGQRNRIFTPWVTFCTFLAQVLQRDCGCREAVNRVQAWRTARSKTAPSLNTAAYCEARGRPKVPFLRRIHEQLRGRLEGRSGAPSLWQGRAVKRIDECGFSMPNTAQNRAVYPYAGGQAKGCGFPTGKLVGLFSLAGHLVRFAHASWKTHEVGLARLLVGWMAPRDVVVADRGFCGWGLLALLLRKDVDVVMPLHQRRQGKPGRQTWAKPQRRETWDRDLWRELPKALVMRVVRFRVEVPGFRTEEVILATSLLDEEAYPDSALIELYRLRWQIEGNFRDIKTTLGLNVLRTRSPAMIEREILLQAIAYNLVRAVLQDAARAHDVPLGRISFKAALTGMRQWAPLLLDAAPAECTRRYLELLTFLASDLLPVRPNRSEPRAVKRRPKFYQYPTKLRREMRVSKYRIQKIDGNAPEPSAIPL